MSPIKEDAVPCASTTLAMPGRTVKDRTVPAFWAFIALHIVVWTALPMTLYANLPLDSVEMQFWGQHWQWGYHKHPPLAAWVARAVSVPLPGSPAGIYLASQLCMAACFWSAWRLGRAVLSPPAALLGAILLECCHFYNYESTLLNNNTLLYACWALAVLFLYWALIDDRLLWWLALGTATGLGLLTKYTMALLALPMLIFLIVHPQARYVWRRPGPYLAAAAALALFAPHLHWAWANDFPTLRWASDRAVHTLGGWGRLWYPLQFAGSQAAVLLPLAAACLPLTSLRWSLRNIEPAQRFSRDFLWTFAVGPFVLHLLVAVVLNWRLRAIWGSPLWTFIGVLLLFCLMLRTQPRRWRQTIVCCGLLATIMVGLRVVRLVGGQLAGRPQRELFQGDELARSAEMVWKEYFDGPLPMVAGEGWLAGNVSFYGQSHAPVYGLMDELVPPRDARICPWLDDKSLASEGGVFVWRADAEDAAATLASMRQRFANLQLAEVVEIPYRGTATPTRIGLAVVPPAANARFTKRFSGSAR